MLYVADDAHHLSDEIRRDGQPDALTDRVFVGEMAADKRFVDEHNLRRGGVITLCQRAATEQRDAHRFQIIRTDDAGVGGKPFTGSNWRAAFYGESIHGHT